MASLCPICADKIGRPGTGRRLVTAAAQPPLPTREEAGAYVEAQTWTFARTMPKWPHEYVLIWKSTSPWTQLRVLAFIRATGERRKWGRHFHHYWTWGITSIGRCRPGRRS